MNNTITVQVVIVPNKNGVLISLKDSKDTIPVVQTLDESTTEVNWKQKNHVYFVSPTETIKENDYIQYKK